MSDDLSQEILGLIERSMPKRRAGMVTATNMTTGRCSVTIANETVTDLPWVGSAPPVGSKVLVYQGVILGVLSASPVVVPDPVTVTVPRLGSIWYGNEVVGDSPPPRPPTGWRGPSAFEADDDDEMPQGNAPMRGDAPPYDPGVVWRLAMAVWADPRPLIPAGATDVRLLLRVRRTPLWPEPIVSPVLYAHTYTLTSPGPTNVRPPMSPGPWEPGGLSPGSAELDPSGVVLSQADGPAATFALPPDVQAGLLNRTRTGLAIYTEDGDKASGFRMKLLLAYTPPPDA